MVKLASTLPKEHEHNGLEPNTRHLLTAYTSQDLVPVVALVRTKEVLSDEDFTKTPKVEIVAIEGAFSEEDAAVVRELLTMLHDNRVQHIKQPLDLPDIDDEDTTTAEPLALEAADVVDAEIVDDEPQPTLTGKDA